MHVINYVCMFQVIKTNNNKNVEENGERKKKHHRKIFNRPNCVFSDTIVLTTALLQKFDKKCNYVDVYMIREAENVCFTILKFTPSKHFYSWRLSKWVCLCR